MLKFRKWSELTKKEKKTSILNIFLVLLGNLSLAFGTAIFLTKLDIVAGGLSGIGIIIQHYVNEVTIFHGWLAEFIGTSVVDLVVFVFTWILWVIGLIFMGKEFALKTLASAIIYPLALALFIRVPLFNSTAENICYFGIKDATLLNDIIKGIEFAPISNLLLCGLFGGVFIGLGVGLNFLGGGSTGGVDVIIAIVNKYTGIKEAFISFILDSIVIILGMFLITRDGQFNIVPSLCGILSAFITAVVIDVVLNNFAQSYQLEVISEKWELISWYAQEELGRGATIIHAKGGYQGDERIILRVVFDKSQYNRLKRFISRVDPHAFVTFTKTNAVYGEGFKNHPIDITNKELEKLIKEKEEK